MKENNIYSKAIPFSIVFLAVILFGTIVTVFIPMMTKEMHPKLETLKPYTAIELAGRNIYQRDGCFNCHTQTVRPLKADVLRYGEYSKAGENYYEHPFLWGSKRTGPDLARIGGKYPDEWHRLHFIKSTDIVPMSNMPDHPWLEKRLLDVNEVEKSMKALSYPYTNEEIIALKTSTELDAIIAYMQVIGTSVERSMLVSVDAALYDNATNPLDNSTAVLDKGRLIFDNNCAGCHGKNGEGRNDLTMAYEDLGDDGQLFVSIANGLEGMMPEHINFMTSDDIWSVIKYVRQLAEKQNGGK